MAFSVIVITLPELSVSLNAVPAGPLRELGVAVAAAALVGAVPTPGPLLVDAIVPPQPTITTAVPATAKAPRSRLHLILRSIPDLLVEGRELIRLESGLPRCYGLVFGSVLRDQGRPTRPKVGRESCCSYCDHRCHDEEPLMGVGDGQCNPQHEHGAEEVHRTHVNRLMAQWSPLTVRAPPRID